MIPRLHLVTDDLILAAADFTDAASAALAAGGGRVAFHLRGPRTSARRLWEIGSNLRPLARAAGAAFLVNDRLDLVLALEADGGHLAGHSLALADARAVLGPAALVGCSVHGRDDVWRAGVGEAGSGAGGRGPRPADFVIAGALFPTSSHSRGEAKGVGLVSEVRDALPDVPVVAIGGINAGSVPKVMATGAHGVAVVRAAWSTRDAAAAVEALLEGLDVRAREPVRTGASATGRP
jgi:thiamine-phosphate pyrophosphorylase